MAQPLSKKDQNGDRYVRRPKIEAAVDLALAQDLETLRTRAAVRDRKSPDYLPSECLVHLIREARRQDDEATMTALLPSLLKRCEDILERKVSKDIADADVVREEIMGQFGELFATDGTPDSSNELDFYEVRFNKAFMTFRINILRKQERTEKVWRRRVPLPDDRGKDLSDDDEFFVSLSEEFRTNPVQETSLFSESLIDAIKSLPPDERKVVILRFMGYEVESDDPDKATIATKCGVTGRTIRNRLRRARGRLSNFKEDQL